MFCSFVNEEMLLVQIKLIT